MEFDEGDPRVEQVALDEVASCRLMLNNQGITEKGRERIRWTEVLSLSEDPVDLCRRPQGIYRSGFL